MNPRSLVHVDSLHDAFDLGAGVGVANREHPELAGDLEFHRHQEERLSRGADDGRDAPGQRAGAVGDDDARTGKRGEVFDDELESLGPGGDAAFDEIRGGRGHPAVVRRGFAPGDGDGMASRIEPALMLPHLMPVEVVDLEVVPAGEEPGEGRLPHARRAAEPKDVRQRVWERGHGRRMMRRPGSREQSSAGGAGQSE